jgi:RND family efflux transporter MFP subunit
MRRFKVLIILIIVLIGIAIAYFWPLILRERVRGKTPIVQEVPVRRVATAKGVVESTDEAEISSKVAGLIQRIMVSENENVKKGQTLVILDKSEVEAQIKEAEALTIKANANYEKDRINYERYERLYKNNAVTLDELEDLRRKLKSSEGELLEAEAQLEYAKAILRNYILHSPINGIVTEKHLEIGEIAREGLPILSIVNTDKLRIKAELDETDVGKVHVGQKVEVFVDAYSERIYKGYVEKISADVKRKSVRTFDPVAWMDINSQEITIKLDSFDGLKIGMTVDARFYPD